MYCFSEMVTLQVCVCLSHFVCTTLLCVCVCVGGVCAWYLVVIRNKMNYFNRCSQADYNTGSRLLAYRLFNMFF